MKEERMATQSLRQFQIFYAGDQTVGGALAVIEEAGKGTE